MKRIAIGFAVVAGFAIPVQAAESLTCSFSQECSGGSACTETNPITLRFQLEGEDWIMAGTDGTTITFTKLAKKSGGMRSFLAKNADPDAAAVSILSVFEDGQAFMSTHGIFLTPGFVTHIGACVPEGN
ncbi:MAG: hypothetical protein ACI8R4_001764 [Paracoccaceae bacterium]|jgi:hypothetical protein